jgi:hypothetical protein
MTIMHTHHHRRPCRRLPARELFFLVLDILHHHTSLTAVALAGTIA